jgi:EmrB/QacA subfamily drug resistance transporter
VTFGSTARDRRWLALALLAGAQFIVVLDSTVVIVALPHIQSDLDFSDANLQWVVNAYTLTFGGFLLLGGRAADLFGRRRVFMIGTLLFGLASLAAGLSQTEAMLIAARAVQGLSGAIVSPAALSIIIATFAEGAERNRALGVWGAVMGVGAAAGSLLGGVLTDAVGWEWVFFINVPIAALVFSGSPPLLAKSRTEPDREGFDIAGALTVTAGLALLIFTMVNTVDHGWSSTRTIVGFIVSVVILAAFVVRETTARHPLVRLGILRDSTRAAANGTAMLAIAAIMAMFYFVSLYMQQVLGASAMRTGFQYLPVAVTIFLTSALASKVVTKVGVRPTLTAGFLFAAAGLGWFTQVSADGTYLNDVLFPSILAAIGIGLSFVSGTLAATAGVKPEEAGLASGLLNTSQQVGGALGLAILSTLAANKTADAIASGSSQAAATANGFQLAFLIGAIFALIAAILAFVFVRPSQADIEQADIEQAEAVPAGA